MWSAFSLNFVERSELNMLIVVSKNLSIVDYLPECGMDSDLFDTSSNLFLGKTLYSLFFLEGSS